MKKGLAGIMIILLIFQMILTIGVVYGDEDLSMSCDGIIKNMDNINIASISENDRFKITVDLKASSSVDLYITFESNSSYKLISAKPGEERKYKAEKDENILELIYLGGGETTLALTAYDNNGNYAYLNLEMPISNVSTPYANPNKPKLVVSGGINMPVVKAGEETKIHIPIENLSSVTAKNIQAILEFDEKDNPFEMEKLNITYSIDRINGKKVEDAVFALKVLDSAAEKVYPVQLNLVYYTLSGKDEQSEKYIIYVKVTNSKKPPKLVATAIGYGDTPLTVGDKKTISVILRNNGALDAKDIRASLKGLRTDGFTLFNSPDVKQVQDIPGNKVIQLDYVLIPSLSMPTGNYDLQLKVDYKDSKAASYSDEFSFFLPVKGLDTTLSDIIIENIETPKAEIKGEESFIVAFDVTNKSAVEADGVKVSLVTDKEIICKSLNIKSLGKMVKDEKKRVEFELYATSEAVTKNYPIQINVDYENGVGDKKVKNNVSQYVGVYVNRGSGKGTPRIIVDRYNIEPYTIQAGDVFQLTMSLLNTSSYATVSNIKVSLVSDDGVFNPVNSSNTIYIESIGPKENIQKVFTLTPKRDAEHKTYGISVNIEYEDEAGAQLSSKDMISVPVIQQAKLVLGDAMVPPEVFMGQTFPVSLEFYNMGKTTLYNLMIKTEGNFATQNSNYYVGNFETGKTDSYDVGITPTEEGAINGRIIFSYENAVGEIFEEVKEIQSNVIQMPMEPMPEPGMGENPGDNGKNKIMSIVKNPYFIGGFIMLAAGIFFAARKIHNKKKGMTFDE